MLSRRFLNHCLFRVEKPFTNGGLIGGPAGHWPPAFHPPVIDSTEKSLFRFLQTEIVLYERVWVVCTFNLMLVPQSALHCVSHLLIHTNTQCFYYMFTLWKPMNWFLVLYSDECIRGVMWGLMSCSRTPWHVEGLPKLSWPSKMRTATESGLPHEACDVKPL